MRRTTPARTPRPRRRTAAIVLLACSVAGWPAAALAEGPTDAVVPIAPITEDPIASTVGAPTLPSGGESLVEETTSTTATATTPATPIAGEAGSEGDDLDASTVAEVRALHARLVEQRAAAQARLLALETTRGAAETRLDAAVDAYARQLVTLFDADETARLQALVAVHETEVGTPDREALVAALVAADRAIIVEQDAASTAVAAAAAQAEAARSEVLSLGTRIDAAQAAIDARTAPTGAELARETGKRFSDDADLIFATGPIPGIGYWGAASGGGLLTGWMGMAGAAVGGIGCTPPDASLQATGSIEQGEASWYGPGFNGQATASGEIYDQTQMTAAHRTLPFGTIVRVYSSTTAKCAFVRITDRGPFIDGRIIDLSRAAADQIGMESVAPVQVEVWAAPGGGAAAPQSTDTPVAPAP